MHQEYVALYLRWREKAELFREHGHEATARTYEVCSAELEAALRDGDEELLNLQEASRKSGYSADHLGRLVRDGKFRTPAVATRPRSGAAICPGGRRSSRGRRTREMAQMRAKTAPPCG